MGGRGWRATLDGDRGVDSGDTSLSGAPGSAGPGDNSGGAFRVGSSSSCGLCCRTCGGDTGSSSDDGRGGSERPGGPQAAASGSGGASAFSDSSSDARVSPPLTAAGRLGAPTCFAAEDATPRIAVAARRGIGGVGQNQLSPNWGAGVGVVRANPATSAPSLICETWRNVAQTCLMIKEMGPERSRINVSDPI